MLDKGEWLDAARRVPEGKTRRVPHACGDGRVLLVSNSAEGWSAWCFRCQDNGWEPRPTESLAERVARATRERDADDALAERATLPIPVNSEPSTWPKPALLWLLKAAVGGPEIRKLGAYHHAPTNRVVLPVVNDGRLQYWQARSIDGRQPKYLGANIDKRGIVAKYGTGDFIVLTEDILSAFRVGQHAEAWSLLGTALSDRIAARLIASNKPVLTWLDPDSAGRKAVARIHRTLSVCGVKLADVKSTRDPKFLSSKEIQSALMSACSGF